MPAFSLQRSKRFIHHNVDILWKTLSNGPLHRARDTEARIFTAFSLVSNHFELLNVSDKHEY